MHGNGWFWPMGLMMVGWLVLAVIIVAAVWLTVANGRPATGHGDSARRILAERYARGELDDEKYRRRLDGALRASPTRFVSCRLRPALRRAA